MGVRTCDCAAPDSIPADAGPEMLLGSVLVVMGTLNERCSNPAVPDEDCELETRITFCDGVTVLCVLVGLFVKVIFIGCG